MVNLRYKGVAFLLDLGSGSRKDLRNKKFPYSDYALTPVGGGWRLFSC